MYNMYTKPSDVFEQTEIKLSKFNSSNSENDYQLSFPSSSLTAHIKSHWVKIVGLMKNLIGSHFINLPVVITQE